MSAEINQLAQALANFKSKYGDYPPSRFLAVESGNYSTLFGNARCSARRHDPDHQLDLRHRAWRHHARSARPAVGRRPSASSGRESSTTTVCRARHWYDFNGNGIAWTRRLHPARPRVPGLLPGGIPADGRAHGNIRHDRFRQDPTNPFTNTLARHDVQANRQPPLFEFNPGRLFLDPNTQTPTIRHPRLLRLARQRVARPASARRPSTSTPIQRLRQRRLRPQRRQFRRT